MKACILILSFLGAAVSAYICIKLLDELDSTNQWLTFLMLLLLLIMCLVAFVFNLSHLKFSGRKKNRNRQ